MNRTQIEWVKNPDGSQGYTWNPITGCLNHYGLPLTPTTHINGLCKGGGFPCYAYRLANGRLKQRYLANPHTALKAQMEASVEEYERQRTDSFYPRFWEERLYHGWGGEPKGIFVCDMSDLFGQGIPREWIEKVLNMARAHHENRYYLLTKQPQNLIKWSPFPENCWVGVTATGSEYLSQALYVGLARIDGSIKFVSFEPLLGKSKLDAVDLKDCGINWLIIGAQTKPYKPPKIEWVREIVEAADKAGIKVFLKDNLLELVNYHSPETDFAFNEDGCYRQEMPSEIRR